jgi:hypothetical protein
VTHASQRRSPPRWLPRTGSGMCSGQDQSGIYADPPRSSSALAHIGPAALPDPGGARAGLRKEASMNTVTPIAPKLGKLIVLLSSGRDGDLIAAVHTIRRTLHARGFDMHELAAAAESGLRGVAISRDPKGQLPGRKRGARLPSGAAPTIADGLTPRNAISSATWCTASAAAASRPQSRRRWLKTLRARLRAGA